MLLFTLSVALVLYSTQPLFQVGYKRMLALFFCIIQNFVTSVLIFYVILFIIYLFIIIYIFIYLFIYWFMYLCIYLFELIMLYLFLTSFSFLVCFCRDSNGCDTINKHHAIIFLLMFVNLNQIRLILMWTWLNQAPSGIRQLSWAMTWVCARTSHIQLHSSWLSASFKPCSSTVKKVIILKATRWFSSTLYFKMLRSLLLRAWQVTWAFLRTDIGTTCSAWYVQPRFHFQSIY